MFRDAYERFEPKHRWVWAAMPLQTLAIVGMLQLEGKDGALGWMLLGGGTAAIILLSLPASGRAPTGKGSPWIVAATAVGALLHAVVLLGFVPAAGGFGFGGPPMLAGIVALTALTTWGAARIDRHETAATPDRVDVSG